MFLSSVFVNKDKNLLNFHYTVMYSKCLVTKVIRNLLGLHNSEFQVKYIFLNVGNCVQFLVCGNCTSEPEQAHHDEEGRLSPLKSTNLSYQTASLHCRDFLLYQTVVRIDG